MIVGKADTGQIIIGLTQADVNEMKKGLTKVKQGNPAYGFKSLMVFMGESDKQMLELLSSATTVRNDDQLPNAGSG